MTGWIKTHRKMKTSPIFSDPHLFKLWMLCLMKASHNEHDQLTGNQIVKLQPGQFVTGRIALTNEYNYGATNSNMAKETTVWRWLKVLEKMQMLDINSTNKYSVISIVKWDEHQSNEQQMDNKRTTNEQQMDTTKNEKNYKNEKNKEIKSELPFERIIDYLNRKTGKAYKHKTAKTRSFIEARFKDSFVAEDFKKVIDVKTAEWKGTKDEKYLRPETLFGTKFESYLNQDPNMLNKSKVIQMKNKEPEYKSNSVDREDYEKLGIGY